MKTTEPGPARDIWLHLLRAGEWQRAEDIRIALPALEAASNLGATLRDMTVAGTVSVRKLNQRVNLYAVTPTSKVTRGVTLRELMAAMPV
jgi:hypothetical protein